MSLAVGSNRRQLYSYILGYTLGNRIDSKFTTFHKSPFRDCYFQDGGPVRSLTWKS